MFATTVSAKTMPNVYNNSLGINLYVPFALNTSGVCGLIICFKSLPKWAKGIKAPRLQSCQRVIYFCKYYLKALYCCPHQVHSGYTHQINAFAQT